MPCGPYYQPSNPTVTCDKLSMYQEDKKDDYWFMDGIISEQYTVGGLDIYVHKYLGPIAHGDDTSSPSHDATMPGRSTTDPTFIEDLLLLENRDRDYDEDVYIMRGVYNVQDIDFDLSQFGMFIQNDTLFVTFHYNNMITNFGRKLMSGDVIEVPNLKDYHPLDSTITKALPKLYSIQDASFSSEGFSQTWAPHLWKIKAVPLVGAQEYRDILIDTYELLADDIDHTADGTQFTADYYTAGIVRADSTTVTVDSEQYTVDSDDRVLENIITLYNKDMELNNAIVTQAEEELPYSGYDVSKFYVAPYGSDGEPDDGTGISADTIAITADGDYIKADRGVVTPESDGWLSGYLTGHNMPPNGLPVTPGTQFPPNPLTGDYVLRLDYQPNRLFRYNGSRWVKVTDGVRTDFGVGPDVNTQHGEFLNNTATLTTSDRGTVSSSQGLSELLEPKADN
jgi:hypothetical protein